MIPPENDRSERTRGTRVNSADGIDGRGLISAKRLGLRRYSYGFALRAKKPLRRIVEVKNWKLTFARRLYRVDRRETVCPNLHADTPLFATLKGNPIDPPYRERS